MLDPILRRSVVERVTGMSRSTIYQAIKDGTFPPPVRITRKAVGWRESDVRSWLDSRERVKRRAGVA